MAKEYWASKIWWVIYPANAALGLFVGIGLIFKSAVDPQTGMFIWAVLFLIYGAMFAWASYLVITKPIIIIDNNELFDRSFFLKNRTYRPLSEFSVNSSHAGLGVLLEKDGKGHPTSSGQLNKEHAEELRSYLLNICSNKRMQSDRPAAGR